MVFIECVCAENFELLQPLTLLTLRAAKIGSETLNPRTFQDLPYAIMASTSGRFAKCGTCVNFFCAVIFYSVLCPSGKRFRRSL